MLRKFVYGPSDGYGRWILLTPKSAWLYSHTKGFGNCYLSAQKDGHELVFDELMTDTLSYHGAQ